MPKRRNDKPRRSKKEDAEWLKAMYDKSRREFTAADLQKFTVIEEGVPLEDVLADCEKILRKFKRKRA